MRSQQEMACWVNREAARFLTSRRHFSLIRQLIGSFVDEVPRDGVMFSIGGIQKLSVNMQISTQILSVKTRRQGGDGLHFFQASLLTIVAIYSECRIQFVDEVQILSIRMEDRMPRSRTWHDLYLNMFF